MGKSERTSSENAQTFALRNKEEVERFSLLLALYFKSQLGWTSGHISLPKAFDKFREHPEGGRLFAALLDLEINFHLLFVEFVYFVGKGNKYYTSKVFEGGGSVLDTKERFFAKMKAHQHASAYILRYRAFWDKLMGFLILAYLPDNYEEFRRAKSRKRKFVQLAKESTFLGEEFADNVSKLIEDFDRKFRTPEAHGTGSLRKWSFLMEDPISNPQSELLSCWNALNSIVVQIVERLDIQYEMNYVSDALSFEI